MSGGPARGCGLGQTSGCHLQGHLGDRQSNSLEESAAVNFTWPAPGANDHSNHGTGVHFQTGCVESIYESLLSARAKPSQSPHFTVEGTSSRLSLAFSGLWAVCERYVSGRWRSLASRSLSALPMAPWEGDPKGDPKGDLNVFRLGWKKETSNRRGTIVVRINIVQHVFLWTLKFEDVSSISLFIKKKKKTKPFLNY